MSEPTELQLIDQPLVGDHMRRQVELLEWHLLQLPNQHAFATRHYLSGGVYGREIFIPAGTVLVGAVHSKDHINVVVGDILVLTEEGPKRLTGHHTLPTKAGMKRAGIALRNTLWTSLIRTDRTNLDDLAAIEDEITPEAYKLQSRLLTLEARRANLLEKEACPL